MDSYVVSEELKRQYLTILKNNRIPKNAWCISDSNGIKHSILPPLPLVGEHYFNQPKGSRILLYGSAENFCGYGDTLSNLCKEEWMDRSRIIFDETREKQFYPNVHIQPINNGGLLIVAYQISKRLLDDSFSSCYENTTPEQFINCISCANWCKFTLQTQNGKNCDYAGNANLLQYSHRFLLADICVLKPDIIIMPRTMYYNGKQKEQFFEANFGCNPSFKVVPIYQINSQVVNTHISSEKSKTTYDYLYSERDLSNNEKLWHENIKAMNRERFMSVYSYLDKLEKNGWK